MNAAKYYARMRPVKIVAMLQNHMRLTSAEVEQYFGQVQQKLQETNILK